MKRLIISVVLLTVVITVSIVGLLYINSNYEKICDLISKGEESVVSGDTIKAGEYIKEAEKRYAAAEKWLSAFVNHSTLDEIGVSIAAIEPFAKGEEAEFLSHCAEAKTALKHLKNDMAISFRNLF